MGVDVGEAVGTVVVVGAGDGVAVFVGVGVITGAGYLNYCSIRKYLAGGHFTFSESTSLVRANNSHRSHSLDSL